MEPNAENSNGRQIKTMQDDENKRASIGQNNNFVKSNSNFTTEGEELVAFSARLIEEGDSSGFIY